MKSWYLENYNPNVTSGYEDDAISQYAQDDFCDVLKIMYSDSVLLCNHDLSESKEINCVVQGNVADTKLKSMERTILAPIGTLHSGDYIYFEDEYWIVDGRPGNNKSYEKATMKECQYKLRWQKNNGTIVERWANLISSSKYNVGESGNNTIILTSNNYSIIIPYDDDGMTIDGKRVFIDLSSIPEKVFKITRNDDVLFYHGNSGGTLSLIADKTELGVRDNQELRICDYIDNSSTTPPSEPTTPDETEDLWHMELEYSTLKIKSLDKDYTIIAHLYNGNNTEITDDIEYEWTVESNIDSYVTYRANSNILTISLSSDCEEYGEKVTISCMSKYTGQSAQIELEVTEVY